MAKDNPVPKNVATNADLERERLNSLINSMADGVIALNEELDIVLYNGSALNILDINGTMTGKPIYRIVNFIDEDNEPVDILSVVKSTTTQFTTRDWSLKYSDGSSINLYLSISPVKLGYGQSGSDGYVPLLRDITREKSLEEERDEFISVVSHELRTPIAIAEGNIGNAQFILDKTGDLVQAKNALSQAHDQVNFLGGMINDLSTLSRAERGVLSVEPETINIHILASELSELYKTDAKKKGLELQVEIDPKLELIRSSRLYIKEILQNFITNAIKYTESGSVTISAIQKPKGVEFKVTDTGIGVSKADKERLFDKFFRSEDYRTRQNNGTGLGLYVTMKLAKLINAKITLDSELNVGSSFSIYIPNIK